MIKNWVLFLRIQIFLCLVAVVSGCFLCSYTADVLDAPARDLMQIVSGRKDVAQMFDSNGIPKVYYPKLKAAFYNPVRIASHANWLYRQGNNPEKGGDNFKTFLKYADWLKDNLKIMHYQGRTYGIWEYHFYWETYHLAPPWRSGMAQGAGLNALGHAYLITKDIRYLSAAKYALNAFLIDVKNGGVTYQDTEEDWWIEEYIGADGRQSRVLNGAIYALLGVYEFWKSTGDEVAFEVYRKGLNGIRKQLPKYDMGWWSYYDAIGSIATSKYHQVHIELTRDLFEISREEIFLRYSERWAHYKDSYFKREFLKQRPDYHDMVILGLNILGIWLIGNLAAGLWLLHRKRFRQRA
jgi:hypothetical protein